MAVNPLGPVHVLLHKIQEFLFEPACSPPLQFHQHSRSGSMEALLQTGKQVVPWRAEEMDHSDILDFQNAPDIMEATYILLASIINPLEMLS
jgi:hypothetical protein